ncbi:MAG TPA: hypothetical protein VEK38_00485 [Candidatus Bathyarchaeia archaeon]|nr:hypothetical protein [Candidatus Bathyarchaeia archaeon]
MKECQIRLLLFLAFILTSTRTHTAENPYFLPLTENHYHAVTAAGINTAFFEKIKTVGRDVLLVKINGAEFVVKKNAHRIEAFLDLLGCHIGELCDIPLNHVRLLPRKQGSRLFGYTSSLVYLVLSQHLPIYTIHTFVCGKTMAQIYNDPGNHCQQNILLGTKPDVTTFGKIMLTHEELAPELLDIVALDLFTLNPDRHNRNYICDENTGNFIGIDMDHCFFPLYLYFHHKEDFQCPTYAHIWLESITEPIQKNTLTIHQCKNIERISATLKKLATTVSPEKILHMATIIAHHVGLPLSSDTKTKLFKFFSRNHKDCIDFAHMLDTLIAKYEKNIPLTQEQRVAQKADKQARQEKRRSILKLCRL